MNYWTNFSAERIVQTDDFTDIITILKFSVYLRRDTPISIIELFYFFKFRIYSKIILCNLSEIDQACVIPYLFFLSFSVFYVSCLLLAL